jgi:preprotein translocase subunit YajC
MILILAVVFLFGVWRFSIARQKQNRYQEQKRLIADEDLRGDIRRR